LKDYFNSKSIIIPKGINNFWFENRFNKPNLKVRKDIKLIYVGDFTQNKILETSKNIAKDLNKIGYNVEFFIIGGGEKRNPK